MSTGFVTFQETFAEKMPGYTVFYIVFIPVLEGVQKRVKMCCINKTAANSARRHRVGSPLSKVVE
jgi:hypothetical protein